MASGFSIPRKPALGICNKPGCSARVLWVTLPSGSRCPVDAEPDERGEVYLLADGPAWRVGLVIRDEELASEAREFGFPLHRFHSDTCSSRRAYRTRRDLD